MKTTHKLPNGTILEKGKKYRLSEWDFGSFVEILYIGDKEFFCKEFFCKADRGCEISLSIKDNWLPYEEPPIKALKPKP